MVNSVPIDLRILYYLHLCPGRAWSKDFDAMWRYIALEYECKNRGFLATPTNINTMLLERISHDK